MGAFEAVPWLAPGLETALKELVAQLVPDAYAAYRPVLSTALGRFLNGLSATRQAQIVQEQLTHPLAAPDERLALLLQHSPLLHKLGQTIARDARLDQTLRHRLQGLEQLPSLLTHHQATQLVTAELGSRRDVVVTGPPMAEASVAVVIPFQWRQGTGSVDAVAKVLKPGIEVRLQEDLAIAADLVPWLQAQGEAGTLPAADYEGLVGGVMDKLRREIALEGEQAHLRAAASLYRYQGGIVIPEPLALSTPRLTAMTRLRGVKITDAPAPQRRRLGELLAGALVATPFWSTRDPVLFHGDPHAGNLMATDDGRLGLLDWSLVIPLGKDRRRAALQLVLGGLALDAGWIEGALAELGKVDRGRLAGPIDSALAQLRRGGFPDLSWVLELLDRTATGGALSLDPDLALLRRALYALKGVGNDLDPGGSFDGPFIAAGLAQLGSDALLWPGCLDHRYLPGHATATDWWRLSWAWTGAWQRVWLQQLGDNGHKTPG